MASNQRSNKNLEEQTKCYTLKFQVLCPLHSKYPSYKSPSILSIGRLLTKLFGCNKYIDIVKEVNQLITSRFEINFNKSKEVPKHTFEQERAKFDTYVKENVDQFTTYVLIDEVSEFKYYHGGDNKKLIINIMRTRIVCVIVCEKLVTISSSHQFSCLIHFLYTYPILQGRGYAK